MNKIVKIIIALVILAAVAAGGFYYFMMPDEVSVEKPEKRDLSLEISEIGYVEADAQVTYYAPVSGTISVVNYSKNSSISKDDVLAEYDLSLLEKEYEIASINSDYQQDGYNAANTENQKNISKASTYAESDSNYKNQYVTTANESNNISNAVNDRENTTGTTRTNLETSISKLQSDMELAKSEYETAVTKVTELETQITTADAELAASDNNIKESEARIEEYKNQLTALDPESEEFATLSEKIASENATLTEAKTESEAIKSKKSVLETSLATAKSERDSAESEVNTMIDKLAYYQDQLASLPTEGMTNAESEKYNELATQLEVINKEWAEAAEKKNTAEANIINQDQLSQYEDAYLLAEAEKDQKLSILEKGKNGVVSGVDGIIVERLVDEGAVVEAGTPLFVVQPKSGYKIKVMISRYDMDSVAVGNKASVIIGDTEYSGEVSFISPIAEEDSTGKPRARVEVVLDDKSVEPVIGIEAEVTITADEKGSVLSVSSSSVYTDDGGDFVYVIDGRKVAKKYFTKGITGNGFAEVTEGLSESDVVITSGVSDENIGESVTTGD